MIHYLRKHASDLCLIQFDHQTFPIDRKAEWTCPVLSQSHKLIRFDHKNVPK